MKPVEYYRKNPDGTLELISQEDMYDRTRFPVGHTLVTVNKNSTQHQYQIKPDTVALKAAATNLKSHLCELLLEAHHPKTTQYTPEQLASWGKLEATGITQLWLPSANEIAERFLEAIIAHAQVATQLPWVQEAQERYEQALALALENHEQ